MKPTRTDFIRQAWLVIMLALLYGAALAGVQLGLTGRIDENRKNETYSVIPTLVPGALQSATLPLDFTSPDGQDWRAYQAFDEAGSHRGWVIASSGQGFAGRIDLLVGLTADRQTITGIYILEQVETPGLGDYITRDYFRERFAGKPVEPPLAIVKREPRADNEVQALSGATVSSESVAQQVNRAVLAIRGYEVPPTPDPGQFPTLPAPAPVQSDSRSGDDV